jgi:hypothetical protein
MASPLGEQGGREEVQSPKRRTWSERWPRPNVASPPRPTPVPCQAFQPQPLSRDSSSPKQGKDKSLQPWADGGPPDMSPLETLCTSVPHILTLGHMGSASVCEGSSLRSLDPRGQSQARALWIHAMERAPCSALHQ